MADVAGECFTLTGLITCFLSVNNEYRNDRPLYQMVISTYTNVSGKQCFCFTAKHRTGQHVQ